MNKWYNNRSFRSTLYFLFVIIAGISFYQLLSNIGVLTANAKLAFKTVSKVLTPLIYGALFAFLMSPGVNFFERKIHSLMEQIKEKLDIESPDTRQTPYRLISIVLVYLVLFGFIILVVQYMIPQFLSNLMELYSNLPQYIRDIETAILALQETMDYAAQYIPQSDLNNLLGMLQPFKLSPDFISSIVGRIFFGALNFTAIAFNIAMGCVIAFYLLKQKEDFVNGSTRLTYALVSKNTGDWLISVAKESNYIFRRFFIGKSLDSLIIGGICFVGLTLLQNRYALLLSIIIGITNMIPYFGPFIGGIPAVLITLFDGLVPALFVALFILALQQFDGLYLGPKILGDSIGLSPFWIIISILIGGAAWGPLGMFFGAPLCAVILLLINRWIDKRLADKNIELNAS